MATELAAANRGHERVHPGMSQQPDLLRSEAEQFSRESLIARALQPCGFDDPSDEELENDEVSGRGGVEETATSSASKGERKHRSADVFRRRAWLHLLHVEYPQDWPVAPRFCFSTSASVAAKANLTQSEDIRAGKGDPGHDELEVEDDDDEDHQPATELTDEQLAQRLHKELNIDGGASNGGLGTREDEWHTVTSKRSKRRPLSSAGTATTISLRDGDAMGDSLVPPTLPDAGGTTRSSASSIAGSSHGGESSARTNGRAQQQAQQRTGNKKTRKKAKQQTDGGSEDTAAGRASSRGQEEALHLPHRDEGQVLLDVKRSFTGLSSSGPLSNPAIREQRRIQLRDLIVYCLRKYPALHYFQGYHDIISVLLLTLSPQHPPASADEKCDLESGRKAWWPSEEEERLVRLACERVTLHVIRDSLTENLDPIMGQLKVLKLALRDANPEFAAIVESVSPLPFFALSWVLTLFSHDTDSLPLMKRIMDFVLSYGPASVVYLSVAILLEMKKDILDLDPDSREDPSVLHHKLACLPALEADVTEAFDNIRQERRARRVEKEAEAREAAQTELSFSDPDVWLPSERLEAAIESRTNGAEDNGSDGSRDHRRKLPLSRVLRKAVALLESSQQSPASSEKASSKSDSAPVNQVMLTDSVLRTWSTVMGKDHHGVQQDWQAQDERAAAIVQVGDNIVKADVMVADLEDEDVQSEEKHSQHVKVAVKTKRKGQRSGKVAAAATGASVAVGVATLAVGAAGVIIMLNQRKEGGADDMNSTAQLGKLAIGAAADILGLLRG